MAKAPRVVRASSPRAAETTGSALRREEAEARRAHEAARSALGAAENSWIPVQGPHHEHPSVPRGALLAAGGLMIGALAATTYVSQTGEGQFRTPPIQAVAATSLVFSLQADGGVMIRKPNAAQPHAVRDRDAGFVHAVITAMDARRRRIGADLSAPYELAVGEDARLVIRDAATDHRIELRAFGRANYDAFARLLPANVADAGGVAIE